MSYLGESTGAALARIAASGVSIDQANQEIARVLAGSSGETAMKALQGGIASNTMKPSTASGAVAATVTASHEAANNVSKTSAPLNPGGAAALPLVPQMPSWFPVVAIGAILFMMTRQK